MTLSGDPRNIPQNIGSIINSPRNNELRYATNLNAKNNIQEKASEQHIANNNLKGIDNIQKIKE